MLNAATAVLPVFAIVLLGFLAGRLAIVGPAAAGQLYRFVTCIALPALVWLVLASTPAGDLLNWRFLATLAAAQLAIAVVAPVIGRALYPERPLTLAMQGIGAGLGNAGFLGLGLFFSLFGAAGLLPATLAILLTSLLGTLLATAALEGFGGSGGDPAAALRRIAAAVLGQPVVVAGLLGIAWSLTGWQAARGILAFFSLTGAAAVPAGLFTLGLTLAVRPRLADLLEAGWISVLKLVWQPILAWLLAAHVFALDPFWTMSAVLLSALPAGLQALDLAQRYHVHEERSAAGLLVSTIAAAVSLLLLSGFYAADFAAVTEAAAKP